MSVRATPGVHEESDSTLVDAARKGKPEAFGFLIRRHEANMFRVAFRITRDRENARDVVQQSFHKAFVNLDRFRATAAFSTWLTRIVINESLMCLRRDRTRRETSLDERLDESDGTCFAALADERRNPEEAYAMEERVQMLSGAIKKLRGDFQSVLLLQLEERTLAEMSQRLRIPLSSLKARLFRARRQLRTVLSNGERPARLPKNVPGDQF